MATVIPFTLSFQVSSVAMDSFLHPTKVCRNKPSLVGDTPEVSDTLAGKTIIRIRAKTGDEGKWGVRVIRQLGEWVAEVGPGAAGSAPSCHG